MKTLRSMDTNGHLSTGQVEEWLEQAGVSADEVDEKQAAAVNEAVKAWAERDPDGTNDAEARQLDEEVLSILRG